VIIESPRVFSAEFRDKLGNEPFAANVGIVVLGWLNWLRTYPKSALHLSLCLLKQSVRNAISVAQLAFGVEAYRFFVGIKTF
jgi:hypothetical protein